MEDLTIQKEQMSTYISNLLHESFGKKPDSVDLTFSQTFMTIYLRNFLSPSEKMIEKLMLKILPEIRSYIQIFAGELEKSYVHNSSYMESYLNKRIIDSFVDWDLTLDKSMSVFILNPKELMGEGDLQKVDWE